MNKLFEKLKDVAIRFWLWLRMPVIEFLHKRKGNVVIALKVEKQWLPFTYFVLTIHEFEELNFYALASGKEFDEYLAQLIEEGVVELTAKPRDE